MWAGCRLHAALAEQVHVLSPYLSLSEVSTACCRVCAPVAGWQVLGGRWKPLHYMVRRLRFAPSSSVAATVSVPCTPLTLGTRRDLVLLDGLYEGHSFFLRLSCLPRPAGLFVQLRRGTFTDILVTCGENGVCFVKNDQAAQPFTGTVVVEALAFRSVGAARLGDRLICFCFL